MLGCLKDGPMVHFRGTDYETRICPRRHAIRHPSIFTIHEVFNQTRNELGVAFLGFSNKMVQGLSVVSDGLAWRRKAEGND
jgi:hypothetical protein|tara:strand:+ start:260 stop:502 length:243 start_codon:yes stop_codon:yes gene_type:complete